MQTLLAAMKQQLDSCFHLWGVQLQRWKTQQVVFSRHNDQFLIRGDANHTMLQITAQESLRLLRMKTVFCHDHEFSSWSRETYEASGQEKSGIRGFSCLPHFWHLLSVRMWFKQTNKKTFCACNSKKTKKKKKQSDWTGKAGQLIWWMLEGKMEFTSTNFSVHRMFPQPADLVTASKAWVIKVTSITVVFCATEASQHHDHR